MQKACICFILWFFCGWQVLSAQTQLQLAEQGKASYYANKFEGRLTANGETFTNSDLTAAHPSLAFNTLVKVTNTTNGKSVVVRINDRGPHTKARILDMSAAAARELDMIRAGIATVQVEVLEDAQHRSREPYSIASIAPRTLSNTAPTPDKKINIPFSYGHTYSLWGTERFPKGFGVQVASFADLQNAKDVCKELLAASVQEVYIQVDLTKGEKIHRVVAGAFPKETEAQLYAHRLDELGFDGFVKKHY
ncbi:septal ring lytic transglycosylase RlpA family protein [Rhodocytophaga aerolata]|uniref:Probable endolytic peptidoglycan transglycosylase RlpA n=1 Tax=Rhodocytophaga aerolata TaxID=455078 RepID=A0ABT8R9S7_9BACT|nr:septal ring lytic transglycosylase RlpA family protein [Rhodocytophaga aerolata]MDO1447445.1 septal ring lytic transglycosylase RlpA family protein [Rhodocytophaga aerolata]